MSVLVHLVYIHGFQGNDTTFQSFPKDLQEWLNSRVPPNSQITIKSSLYPTYKSVKPISHATKNFLEWLSTQPPGPVILLGHSMGGLLAAEAATSAANNQKTKGKRIVGVIAFDTPYLGMHPHVVVSGIASLLPGKKDDKAESEELMNQHPQVEIVDNKVTDDWEAFKQQSHLRPRLNAPFPSDSGSVLLSPTPTSSTLSLSSRPSSPSGFTERALSYIAAHSDEPVKRWLRKHADDPFSAGKRWVVERFQFGSCMFSATGLKDRYERFVLWDGLWVNYWTTSAVNARDDDDSSSNDDALKVNGLVDDKPRPKEEKSKSRWFRSGEEKEKKKFGRHFVVLPNGLGSFLGGMEKWEHVEIAAAQDEVAAHTGLFMPHLNLGYPALIERVAHRILTWCDHLPVAEYTPNTDFR